MAVSPGAMKEAMVLRTYRRTLPSVLRVIVTVFTYEALLLPYYALRWAWAGPLPEPQGDGLPPRPCPHVCAESPSPLGPKTRFPPRTKGRRLRGAGMDMVAFTAPAASLSR